ncbi:MAG: flagellar hook-associated protein FlgK, partial [Proteobacteria bacterium]|nr:flagellar hook-associated protein FlgK [Pseudomonadota bacterium]
MVGISQILNTAKEALLAHQQAVSVAGHNIANVDTPGYTRQTLTLTPNLPTPEGVGFFGNGVRGMEINRHYDQFMVKRLIGQNSTLSNLEAQQQSMRLVETSFNEVPGMAVNELMSEFWASWQTLASYPENLSTRDSTVQKAKILIDQFHNMNTELAQTRYDIDVSLSSAVNDVNALTKQLAKLNEQIAGSETDLNKQNDLRDQRDIVLNNLSQYMDVNYFETGTGAYTILMRDGHTLVENNEAWQIDWQDDQLQWISTNAKGTQTKTGIATGAEVGGSIGGWMEIFTQVKPGVADNYLGRLDALANALIREVNQQHSQGVGLTSLSEQLTSADPAANTTLLTSTLDPALATETIPAGSLTINDRVIGKIEGGTASFGLAKTK